MSLGPARGRSGLQWFPFSLLSHVLLLSLTLLAMAGSGCAYRRLGPGAPRIHGWRSHRGHHHHHDRYPLLELLVESLRADPVPEPPPQRSPQLGAATASDTWVTRDGKVRSLSVFRGGHLELIGLPSRSQSHVVLAIRPVAPFGPAPCVLRLYRDGVALPVDEVVRSGDHQLLASVAVAALGGPAPSARLSGYGCGRSFELDQAGRATVAAFAARFRERCDLLTASTLVAKATEDTP